MSQSAVAAPAASSSPAVATYWASPEPLLLEAMDSRTDGLTTREAARRRRRGGEPAAHHRRTRLVLLMRQLSSPIIVILIFATVVSALLGEETDALIILAIVLLSSLLSAWQEYGASRAVEDLLATVQVTVEVARDGKRTFRPVDEIVPGDIVFLDTGDLVPGDCRLLEARELQVDQAPLTGESFPIEKSTGVLNRETVLVDRTNCLFQGTHIVRGTGTAVVVHVGGDTEFGRIAHELERTQPATRFERGLTQFGKMLLYVMVTLVGMIFVANILLARPIVESFLFSTALAVGLTPQLLPAIVSVSLSIGARQMAQARVIVKRLSAIEDFGGMDVLCTDKTGTLTEGTVRLAAALDVDGRPSKTVLAAAYLNAVHQSGFPNPIDSALLAVPLMDAPIADRLGELAYDFQRRRLSVLVGLDGERRLLTKGAVDSVLAVCTSMERGDGGEEPLEGARSALTRQFEALSQQGFRVLGVARRSLDADCELTLSAESEMTFLGFLTFRDPPKSGVARTLRELRSLGVRVCMITGDSSLAAAHIARAVGLDGRHVLTGQEIAVLDDAALTQRVEQIVVFAAIDPVQKERIIRAFQRAGRDVGFLGDGINDAPALHTADVGISVESAVDVAKDAASIVLLDKDLDVLLRGVRLGRRTFANTLKYMFVTTSANFGNMVSMAVVSLALPFLPLLPLQILLINFLSDLPGTAIATDRVDPELLERPGEWDLGFIRNFMIVFGLISSAFDFITFGTLRIVFAGNEDLFRSGWFLESVATELAVMLVLRTRRPFFKSGPGRALLGGSVAVAVITVALPFSPIAGQLGLTPVPISVLTALAIITASYVAVTELAKFHFYSRQAVSASR